MDLYPYNALTNFKVKLNPTIELTGDYEVGLAEISVREKSGLLAYSPLASGYLSGKYRNGQMPKNSRMDLFF